MKRLLVISLAILFLAAGTALAQDDVMQPRRPAPMGMRGGGGGPMGGHGGPGAPLQFERQLFPPEMVLHNQLALNLTEEQLTTIKTLLNETHGRVLDLQTDLARNMERLNGLLEPSRVDEAAALSAAEETMRLESRIKREHLALLVRVKNLLTEEQQETLRSLRPPRPQN